MMITIIIVRRGLSVHNDEVYWRSERRTGACIMNIENVVPPQRGSARREYTPHRGIRAVPPRADTKDGYF